MSDELKALLLQFDNEHLSEFTRHYHYNPNGADYECLFCHRMPKTNKHDIEHASDCLGIKLLTALTELH